MCKCKGQGRRCPVTTQRKQSESYRQKVKYRAKKEGMTSQEWLSTEKGHEFQQNNDPKILNPNWEKEHQAELANMKHTDHPQVTMNDDFTATPQDLSILEANFLADDALRGTEPHAVLEEGEYYQRIKKYDEAHPLQRDEELTLMRYTSSEYRAINAYLREVKDGMSYNDYQKAFYYSWGTENVADKDDNLRSNVQHLDNMLATRRENQEITYRCISGEGNLESGLEAYKANSVITFDNYASTSHKPAIAMGFSNHTPSSKDGEKVYELDDFAQAEYSIMFEVQTNAGKAIANYSAMSHEREVLLPRGVNFKVVKTIVPTEENPYHLNNSMNEASKITSHCMVVQLVECDKDGNIYQPDHQEKHNPPALPERPKEFDEFREKKRLRRQEEQKEFTSNESLPEMPVQKTTATKAKPKAKPKAPKATPPKAKIIPPTVDESLVYDEFAMEQEASNDSWDFNPEHSQLLAKIMAMGKGHE